MVIERRECPKLIWGPAESYVVQMRTKQSVFSSAVKKLEPLALLFKGNGFKGNKKQF